MREVLIGTAGWAIPKASADHFSSEGSGLQRYVSRFDAVELNTTFYRPHRVSTYARWRTATPAKFKFAVKLPRTISHHARLVDTDELVAQFRAEAGELGEKLGPLLVQLPPTLVFEPSVALRFFSSLRDRWPEAIACEPRHPSWFENDAEALLRAHKVSRVAADPAPHPAATSPGGWEGVAYWRLHGSPRMYFSAYSDPALSALATRLRSSRASQIWCIFDNTASGAAAADALRLKAMLDPHALADAVRQATP